MSKVCTKFNEVGSKMLSRGFIHLERRHAVIYKRVKQALPRRESERKTHPLARHNDILQAVETRISMLNMTYTRYIELKLCCFIPGKVLDEMRNVLNMAESDQTPPRTHQVLQELRDLSSMAIEHFDEHILPRVKEQLEMRTGSPENKLKELEVVAGSLRPFSRFQDVLCQNVASSSKTTKLLLQQQVQQVLSSELLRVKKQGKTHKHHIVHLSQSTNKLYLKIHNSTCRGKNVGSVKGSLLEAQSEAKMWFTKNELHLNENKTYKMLFTLREFHGVEGLQDIVRFLGLMIDPELRWHLHVDYMRKQAQRMNLQSVKIREQERKIQEQTTKILEQEASLNEIKKHVDEWDQKYKDLTAELIRARDEILMKTTASHTAVSPPISDKSSLPPKHYKSNIKPRVAHILPKNYLQVDIERKRKSNLLPEIPLKRNKSPTPVAFTNLTSTVNEPPTIKTIKPQRELDLIELKIPEMPSLMYTPSSTVTTRGSTVNSECEETIVNEDLSGNIRKRSLLFDNGDLGSIISSSIENILMNPLAGLSKRRKMPDDIDLK